MTNILSLPVLAMAASTSRDGDCLLAFGLSDESSPVDLTGISFGLQWRLDPAAIDVALTASTDAQYLTLGTTAGTLALSIPQASLVTIPAGTYTADLIAKADGHIVVIGTLSFVHADRGESIINSLVLTPRVPIVWPTQTQATVQ